MKTIKTTRGTFDITTGTSKLFGNPTIELSIKGKVFAMINTNRWVEATIDMKKDIAIRLYNGFTKE